MIVAGGGRSGERSNDAERSQQCDAVEGYVPLPGSWRIAGHLAMFVFREKMLSFHEPESRGCPDTDVSVGLPQMIRKSRSTFVSPLIRELEK